jgi:AraC-like DNA-binding protein
MDLLADVLDITGVRGVVAATVEAGEPWGFALEPVADAAFHAITAGTAWLRVTGHSPVRLMPGDVVLFPTGAAHALASEQEGPLTPWASLAADPRYEHSRSIEIGTRPSRTRILCAAYQHDRVVSTPVFALLPSVMHVPAGSLSGSLTDTMRLIGAELTDHDLASSTVLNRLVDIVLIQLLRGWLRAENEASALPVSWLRGLTDPTITTALTAMHAEPAQAWTVESLANRAAVSRATLARKFAAVVGESPAAYLTRWRMDLAARRLRDTDDPVDAVARAVGYRSVFAFSRAFARERSVSPGRYRTQSRTGGSDRSYESRT